MHVGAQRVGNDAGIERLARKAIREVAAVTDVDLEAAVQRGADHFMDLALPVDEAAGVSREGMSQNIARLQFRDHPIENGVGVFTVGPALGESPELAEMDVDRKLGLAADLRGHLQDLDAPARKATDLGVSLDAAHQVAVLIGRPHRRVDIDAFGAVEVRIVVPLKSAHEVRREERVTRVLAGSATK